MSDNLTSNHVFFKELREARLMWLDAERRAANYQNELQNSKKRVFELQQLLLKQATERMCDSVSSPWVAMAHEIRSKA